MNRQSLFALAAGVASALLYLSILSGSPGSFVLAYFSQAPLFLVGLALGLVPAAIACGIALVGLVAATEVATAALFVLLTALPVVYVVRQALLSRQVAAGQTEWYPPGLILAGLTAYGLVLLAAAALYFAGEPGGLETAARHYLESVLQLSSGADKEIVASTIELVARYIPGTVIGSAAIMVVINAALAQGALAKTGNALRPSPSYHRVALPGWLAIALPVAVAAAFVPGRIGFLGGNAAVIVAVPFALVGLAVLHCVSRRWPARGLALGFIYLTTVLLGWPAILVAGIGVVDHWSPLRRGEDD
jgi:Predicted membrane protein (DUF2232)